MRSKRRNVLICSLGLLAVVAGATALTTDVEAKPPTGPLCGPTILYECTFSDGSTALVGLTVCEVKHFERTNQASCEPATFP